MKPSSRSKSTVTSSSPTLSGDDASLYDLPGGERVYRILISAIERGELVGGTRLRELDLAKQIGVSRTPVREALARLEEQGIVVSDGSRGMVVGELDHRAITELYTMREVLEGTAARLAAQHASEVEITILRKIVERHDQLSDPLDLAENNKLFHGTLYRCSHNRYLLKMLRSTHEAMLLLGQSALSKTGSSAEWTREHLDLVEAIENHDGELAEKLARALIAAAFSARLTQVIANLGNKY
ncbi:MAG: GntR family transcriptional regulator [Pusillimonas sp.]